MVPINWQATGSSSFSADHPAPHQAGVQARPVPQSVAPSHAAALSQTGDQPWFGVAMGLLGIIVGYAVRTAGLI